MAALVLAVTTQECGKVFCSPGWQNLLQRDLNAYDLLGVLYAFLLNGRVADCRINIFVNFYGFYMSLEQCINRAMSVKLHDLHLLDIILHYRSIMMSSHQMCSPHGQKTEVNILILVQYLQTHYFPYFHYTHLFQLKTNFLSFPPIVIPYFRTVPIAVCRLPIIQKTGKTCPFVL